MKTRVMAFGTFEYLHAGHESYLKKAAELGEELIVVVARDQTAESIRGYQLKRNERQRLKAVEALPFVTKAVLGDAKDKYKVLKKFRPSILALGYDQFVFTQQLPKILINLALDAKIIRLPSYKPEMYKSTLIRENEGPDNSDETSKITV
ncbi:MAG: adenylyltransferase/cytidyltransferase family protein [Candidatus Gracilibacteria bacterium]